MLMFLLLEEILQDLSLFVVRRIITFSHIFFRKRLCPEILLISMRNTLDVLSCLERNIENKLRIKEKKPQPWREQKDQIKKCVIPGYRCRSELLNNPIWFWSFLWQSVWLPKLDVSNFQSLCCSRGLLWSFQRNLVNLEPGQWRHAGVKSHLVWCYIDSKVLNRSRPRYWLSL